MSISMIRRLAVAFCLSMTPAVAQITTADLTTGLTPMDLVQHLVGDCVTVSNVTYTGAPVAAGTFVDAGATGLPAGIVLSSGNIANVIGPNVADNITTINGTAGDASLNTLVPGITTMDAAVLEFDFECDKSLAITFEYVFASDEYNEWVGSQFNDVFGFFLNGTNIALLPGGTPVAINSVNCGNPYAPPGGGSNCSLFRNNDLSDGGGAINTEMDGLTVVFSCTTRVNPGINHIKLAVADASDQRFDSVVFLKAESFVCKKIEVDIDIKPGSCPNSFNCKGKGVLPVAVLGTATFDVTQIDVPTVRLSRVDGLGGSVAPHEGPPGPHSVIEDAGTPFPGDPCNCHTLTGDGFDDLSVKFKTQEVVDALFPECIANTEIPLQVTGYLLDGTYFFGVDCIRMVPAAGPPGRVRVRSGQEDLWVEILPLDLQLDGGGFGDFDRSYPLGTVVTFTAPAATPSGSLFSGWLLDALQIGVQPVLQLPVTMADVELRLSYLP